MELNIPRVRGEDIVHMLRQKNVEVAETLCGFLANTEHREDCSRSVRIVRASDGGKEGAQTSRHIEDLAEWADLRTLNLLEAVSIPLIDGITALMEEERIHEIVAIGVLRGGHSSPYTAINFGVRFMREGDHFRLSHFSDYPQRVWNKGAAFAFAPTKHLAELPVLE